MISIKNAPAAPSGFLRQKRLIVVASPAPAVTTGAAVMTSRPESATAGFVATLRRSKTNVRIETLSPIKTVQPRGPDGSKQHDRPIKTVQRRRFHRPAPARSEHHGPIQTVQTPAPARSEHHRPIKTVQMRGGEERRPSRTTLYVAGRSDEPTT